MKRTFQQNDCVGKIPNAEIYWQMFEYAKSKGVPVYEESYKSDYQTYPNIAFNKSELRPDSMTYGGDRFNWITHEQFYEFCDNWAECQAKRLQLNSEYSAEINHSTSTVKVGCQFFTFEKITELYNAIQKQP